MDHMSTIMVLARKQVAHGVKESLKRLLQLCFMRTIYKGWTGRNEASEEWKSALKLAESPPRTGGGRKGARCEDMAKGLDWWEPLYLVDVCN